MIGIGDYHLQIRDEKTLILKDVLYSVGMRVNLVYVSSLLENSYEVIFSRDRVSIKRHNVTFAFGIINNDLF